MSERYPRVAGRCPMGCGETLFLGSGGHVTCSYLPCPNPTRISELLDSFGKERHLIFVARESEMHRVPNTSAAPPHAIGFSMDTTLKIKREAPDEPR